MLAELGVWSRTRWLSAAGTTTVAAATLLLATGLLHGGPFTSTAELWLAAPLLLAGSLALGALIAGPTRLVVGAAASLLLVWALRQRLDTERRARNAEDGVICTTCRPLFAGTRQPSPTQETP